MSKLFYVVPIIKKEHEVSINNYPGYTSRLELSWTDGMYGVMPVFTNKRKAEKYAGKLKHKIIVFEEV